MWAARGTRKQQEQQEELWVATAKLPRSAGHPFYERLNELLEESGFDAFVEERCRRFYAPKMGRPVLSLPKGRVWRRDRLSSNFLPGIDRCRLNWGSRWNRLKVGEVQ